MNNNIPNNINNGGSGNQNGGVSNPIIDHANEQLVGGQSKTGMGPSPMQGQSNVPNNPGVMQGTPNVPNNPGVMQGAASAPQKPVDSTPIVPGQVNSGINAYTMQYEKPGEEVEIQNAKQNQSGTVAVPNMGTLPGENNAPKPANFPQPPKPTSNLNGNSPMNNINSQIPNPNNTVMGAPMNNQTAPVNNNPNQGMNSVPNQGMNSIPNQGLNNNPNQGMNSVPNQGLNNNPNQGMNSVPDQGLNNIPNQPIAPPASSNNQNTQSNVMMGNNQGTSFGIKPTPTQNEGLSQVGQTEVNHQSIPSDISVEEPVTKKFPLSIREMVLIGIAIVGIIVVIIMYLPKN